MTEAEQERARELIPTQADREAVARRYQNRRDHDYAAWVLHGEKDSTSELQEAAAHRNAALEEAAALIEKRHIAYSSDGPPYLQVRHEGDINGLAYAVAIRALKAPERGDHRKDGR